MTDIFLPMHLNTHLPTCPTTQPSVISTEPVKSDYPPTFLPVYSYLPANVANTSDHIPDPMPPACLHAALLSKKIYVKEKPDVLQML